MVNWDVVSEDWHDLQTNMRDMGTQLEKGRKKISGRWEKLGATSSPAGAPQGRYQTAGFFRRTKKGPAILSETGPSLGERP
jgi:hypothetical protein